MGRIQTVDQISEAELVITIVNTDESIFKSIGENPIYYHRVKDFGKEYIDKLSEILAPLPTYPITNIPPSSIDEEIAKLLMKKGFYYSEQIQFLMIEPEYHPYILRDIRVEVVREETMEDFLDLVACSNEIELSAREKEASAVAHIQGFIDYMVQTSEIDFIVYLQDEAVGMGSLFVDGEEGYIGNDFVFPGARGKGVQRALSHYRMNVATQLGLNRVYTDVEYGTESYKNMLNSGFKQVFLNSFWVIGE